MIFSVLNTLMGRDRMVDTLPVNRVLGRSVSDMMVDGVMVMVTEFFLLLNFAVFNQNLKTIGQVRF